MQAVSLIPYESYRRPSPPPAHDLRLERLKVDAELAFAREAQLIVEAPDLQHRLRVCVDAALLSGFPRRRRVMVVLPNAARIDRFIAGELPALRCDCPRFRVKRLDSTTDLHAIDSIQDADLALITYDVLAWHLRLREFSDIELLPIPDLVLFENADLSYQSFREALGFTVSFRALDDLIADLRRIGQLALSSRLWLASRRLQLHLYSHLKKSPENHSVEFQTDHLATLLHGLRQAEGYFEASSRMPQHSVFALARQERCRLNFTRLSWIRDAHEHSLVCHSRLSDKGITLHAMPEEVAPTLRAGLLDHVRGAVLLSASMRRLNGVEAAAQAWGFHPSAERVTR